MAQINLTTTKLVKLKTQEKYCEEDIEIIPNLQEKTIKPTTEKQEVLVDEGFSGLNKVNVDPINVGSKTFNENGEYSASDSGIDGWNKITIDVGGSAEVDILLPESFYGKTIYWFKINDNELLVSSNFANAGLNIYNITNQTMQNVFDGGYYSQYKQVGEDILFCSATSSKTGFYKYNINTNEVSVIIDTGYNFLLDDWITLDDKNALFVANTMFGVFNYETKTIVSSLKLSSINSSTYQFVKVGQDYITNVNSSSSNYKMYIYVYSTNTFKEAETKLYATSSSFKLTVYDAGNSNYLLTNSNSGTYLYSSSTTSVSKIWNYGSTSSTYTKLNNCILIKNNQYVGVFYFDTLMVSDLFSDFGSSLYIEKCGETKAIITTGTSNFQGIRIFRSADNTYSQISTTGYGYIKLIPTKNGCLFCGTSSSFKGLFYVDEQTEDIVEKMANVISSYLTIVNKNEFGIYLGYSNKSFLGVYLFNENDAEISQVYDKGYGYGYNTENFPDINIENGLICFGSYGQILYINNNTGEVSEIFAGTVNAGKWVNSLIDGSNYYLASPSNYGIYVIDASTMSGKHLYPSGSYLTIAKKIFDGIYFVCDTKKASTTGIYYYDYISCDQILSTGFFDTIMQGSSNNVIIENIGASSSYKLKVKFNPQTREKQVYYKLGEI